MPRGVDRPGSLRRYRVESASPEPEAVHRAIEESLGGVIDIDHTLRVARHWGGLPADTVVVEVEPAECSFGLGFTELLGDSLDAIVDVLRQELRDLGAGVRPGLASGSAPDASDGDVAASLPAGEQVPQPSDGLADFVGYGEYHRRVRTAQRARRPLAGRAIPSHPAPGVVAAARSKPWGIGLDDGGDWVDVVPFAGGGVGVVVGDVGGRGVEAAMTMVELRAATQAYVIAAPDHPARALQNLERLARSTGLGLGAEVLYATVDPPSGRIVFAAAGQCLPFLRSPEGSVRLLGFPRTSAVGAATVVERHDTEGAVPHGSTLVFYSRGLVESRTTSLEQGLHRLEQAVADGPDDVDDLCDHVLATCLRTLQRDDDICLLAVKRTK